MVRTRLLLVHLRSCLFETSLSSSTYDQNRLHFTRSAAGSGFFHRGVWRSLKNSVRIAQFLRLQLLLFVHAVREVSRVRQNETFSWLDAPLSSLVTLWSISSTILGGRSSPGEPSDEPQQSPRIHFLEDLLPLMELGLRRIEYSKQQHLSTNITHVSTQPRNVVPITLYCSKKLMLLELCRTSGCQRNVLWISSNRCPMLKNGMLHRAMLERCPLNSSMVKSSCNMALKS